MATRFISIVIVFASMAILSSTANANENTQPLETYTDQLIPLLKAQQFADISDKLGKLHRAYESDPKTENEFHKLVYEFGRADPEIENPLDAWIAQRPDDPFAYLARGLYRTRMGWLNRGASSARNTSSGQFKEMASWFALAKSDLNLAISKHPSLVEAYCYLIEIDMNEGGRATRALYDQALKLNPESFIAREFFLHSLLPRWGGSYDEMAQVIESSKHYYGPMPQLATLEGRMAADVGEILTSRRDFQQAQGYFKRALEKGDFWFPNQKYGELLYEIDNYNGAIEQFSKVIAYKPGYKRAWWMRSQSYKMLSKFPQAIADINRTIAIEPNDDLPIAARGHIYMAYGRLNLALKDFETAEAINPSNQSHKQAIAMVRKKLGTNR